MDDSYRLFNVSFFSVAIRKSTRKEFFRRMVVLNQIISINFLTFDTSDANPNIIFISFHLNWQTDRIGIDSIVFYHVKPKKSDLKSHSNFILIFLIREIIDPAEFDRISPIKNSVMELTGWSRSLFTTELI